MDPRCESNTSAVSYDEDDDEESTDMVPGEDCYDINNYAPNPNSVHLAQYQSLLANNKSSPSPAASSSASARSRSMQLLPNGKKTKGRVKIKMEFIDNKLRRYTTFSKRKTGIMKKAYELSTLTGTQVMLLVASETGHVYTFATKKLQPIITSQTGKSLIQQCLSAPDGDHFVDGDMPPLKKVHLDEESTYSSDDDVEKDDNSNLYWRLSDGAEATSSSFGSALPTMVPPATSSVIISKSSDQSQSTSSNTKMLNGMRKSASPDSVSNDISEKNVSDVKNGANNSVMTTMSPDSFNSLMANFVLHNNAFQVAGLSRSTDTVVNQTPLLFTANTIAANDKNGGHNNNNTIQDLLMAFQHQQQSTNANSQSQQYFIPVPNQVQFVSTVGLNGETQ